MKHGWSFISLATVFIYLFIIIKLYLKNLLQHIWTWFIKDQFEIFKTTTINYEIIIQSNDSVMQRFNRFCNILIRIIIWITHHKWFILNPKWLYNKSITNKVFCWNEWIHMRILAIIATIIIQCYLEHIRILVQLNSPKWSTT